MAIEPSQTSGSKPKYVVLMDELRLFAQAQGPGAHLDSERSLMETHGVSRATVRRAISELVHEGVLVSRPGAGTFVAEPSVQTDLHLASFTEDMTRRGHTPSTRVLEVRRQRPTASVAQLFDTGEPVWHIARIRLADGEPMAYEEQVINPRLAPDLGSKDLAGSVYEVLEHDYDCPVDAAEQNLWGTVADERLAELLEIRPGQALLVFDRISTSRGRPLESVRSWYRADRYSIHMSLDSSMRG